MKPSSLPIQKELLELLPAELHDFCVTSFCEKGELLFVTGKKPVSMHFITSGEVVLQRRGMQGESVILQRTRFGFVGEASLQSERYHCDAKVTVSAEITRVPIQQIRSVMTTDPAFSTRWIGMLNLEVKRLRLQCERLSLHKVQDRLLHLLETEGTQGKYPLGSGLKSLAGDLGVTHEALYRCVSAMVKKNILSRDNGFLSFSPVV